MVRNTLRIAIGSPRQLLRRFGLWYITQQLRSA